MSIRLDAYTDRLGYNATPLPPVPDGCTVTGWIYLSSTVNNNDGYTIFQVSSNHNGIIDGQFIIGTDLSNHMGLITVGGSAYVTDLPIGLDQWYWFIARVGVLGITNELEFDLGTADNMTSVTHYSRTPGDASGSPTDVWVGGQMPSEEDEFWNGLLAYFRVWTAALTNEEALAEIRSTTPVRTADLWADWPLPSASDLTDHSGNGHDLVAGSSAVTTDDNDPPITAQQYTPVITSTIGIHDLASDVDARAFHGLVDDHLGITDTTDVVLQRQFTRTIDESIGVIDVLVDTQSVAVTASESIGLTDVVIAGRSLDADLNSNVGISESMTTWLDRAQSSVESVGVTDVVNVTLARGYVLELTSPVGLTDVVAPARDAVVELTSSITITDVASDVDARSFHGLILDHINVDDAAEYLLQRRFNPTFSDTLGITDDVEFLHIGRPTLTLEETISLTDHAIASIHSGVESLLRIRVSGTEPGRR